MRIKAVCSFRGTAFGASPLWGRQHIPLGMPAPDEPLICADCVTLICADRRYPVSANQRFIRYDNLGQGVNSRTWESQLARAAIVIVPPPPSLLITQSKGLMNGLAR